MNYRSSIMEIRTGQYLTGTADGKYIFGEESDRLIFFDEADAENTLAELNDTTEFSCVLLDENI